MPDWHLYAKFGDTTTVLRFPSWEAIRGRVRSMAQDRLDKATAATVCEEIRIAREDQSWHLAAETCVIKIRPLKEHPPLDNSINPPPEIVADYEKGHSTLGASGCHRWWNCLGSNNAVRAVREQFGPAPPSIFAQEGTAAHNLGYECLRQGQDAIEYIGRRIPVHDDDGVVEVEFEVTDEMATAVQVYLDECRKLMVPGNDWFLEERFTLEALHPPAPMFGRCDFGAINKAQRKLTIIDYKHGAGVTVAIEGNPQPMYYGLGALVKFRDVPIDLLETIIVQPRGMGKIVKTATYTKQALFDWYINLMEQARKTLDPDAPRTAGTWCRTHFCEAAGRCDTYAAYCHAVAQSEFKADPLPAEEFAKKLPETRLLSPVQRGAMKLQFQALRDWMNAVDESIKQDIQNNIPVPIPGGGEWALEQGLGYRAWKAPDPSDTEAALTKAGLGKDRIWETKLISPKTAETLIIAKARTDFEMKLKDAKPMVEKFIAGITVRPLTAPALVPARPSNRALPDARSEFSAESAATRKSENV